MKLGEVKIEALKLMFANGMDQLTISNYGNTGANGSAALDLTQAEADPQYADYLHNMTGSINRCYSVLESRRVLPTKRKVLVESAPYTDGDYEIDLSQHDDVDDVQRVVLEHIFGTTNDADFYTEGNILKLPYVSTGDQIRLVYYPRLSRLTSTAGNDTELPMPDKIACIIPYFIKYDLYREDDAGEANEALRQFERMLADLDSTQTRQTSVDTVIGMW